MTLAPFRTSDLYCLKAENLPQWLRSIFSVAPHPSCFVMKPYLLPIISPSKNVVSVGLSSVRPVYVFYRRSVIVHATDDAAAAIGCLGSNQDAVVKQISKKKPSGACQLRAVALLTLDL